MKLQTINFQLEPRGLAQEVLQLSEIVNRSPELTKGIIDVADSRPVNIQLDSAIATGANDVVIRLKPSERLMELMAAFRTLKVEGLVG